MPQNSKVLLGLSQIGIDLSKPIVHISDGCFLQAAKRNIAFARTAQKLRWDAIDNSQIISLSNQKKSLTMFK